MSDSSENLELSKSIPLGIQHVLAMFAGNITVPIIVAGVFGQTPILNRPPTLYTNNHVLVQPILVHG